MDTLRQPIDAPVLQDFGTNRALYRSLGQLGHTADDTEESA